MVRSYIYISIPGILVLIKLRNDISYIKSKIDRFLVSNSTQICLGTYTCAFDVNKVRFKQATLPALLCAAACVFFFVGCDCHCASLHSLGEPAWLLNLSPGMASLLAGELYCVFPGQCYDLFLVVPDLRSLTEPLKICCGHDKKKHMQSDEQFYHMNCTVGMQRGGRTSIA